MHTDSSMDRGDREANDRQRLSEAICFIMDRQKLSEAICFKMDNVGYSDEMRRFRIQEYDKISKRAHSVLSSTSGVSFYNTGSKAEGLSLPFQGDMDTMYVLNDSVCVDDPSVSECRAWQVGRHCTKEPGSKPQW